MTRKQYNSWYHRQQKARLKRAKRQARLNILGVVLFAIAIGGILFFAR